MPCICILTFCRERDLKRNPSCAAPCTNASSSGDDACSMAFVPVHAIRHEPILGALSSCGNAYVVLTCSGYAVYLAIKAYEPPPSGARLQDS